MDSEHKAGAPSTGHLPTDSLQEPSNNPESLTHSARNERKEDEEEEEEEEEEDKIVERSHNHRFHKRNKKFPKQIKGVDSAFVAIEPKSGKEVIWNECLLSEKKSEKEQNRYLSIIKKLKKNSHPFLARFLDAWISKSKEGERKLVFITERLDECSLKQFLCNSPKNSRSWKRHVGQILSVLMFLHRLGIAHGNLTKETIYYQNSGNLRVGPFALGACLDQKSQSSDVYSLGIVALEIAVWSPTDFPQNLPQEELLQGMFALLEDDAKRNFIEICLDPNPPTGDRIKRLVNHVAVTEVPVLKLLSAKVIVSTMRSGTSEDGTTAEQTGFAELLKECLSHYEDDAVIVEVHFKHDNIVNSRSWKDFRSNFTLTPKFLDDVKNGFYPLFGCRWAAYQDEEEDSFGAAPINGMMGISSTASLAGRGEVTTLPSSQAHSSVCSTVPSASVSRKQSAVMKMGEPICTVPILMEDEPTGNTQQKNEIIHSLGVDDPARKSDPSSVPSQPLFQHTPLTFSKDEASSKSAVALANGVAEHIRSNADSQQEPQFVNTNPVSSGGALRSSSVPVFDAQKAESVGPLPTVRIKPESPDKTQIKIDEPQTKFEEPAAAPIHDSGLANGVRVDFLIGTGQEPEPVAPPYPIVNSYAIPKAEPSAQVDQSLLPDQTLQAPNHVTEEEDDKEEDDDEDNDEEDDEDDEEKVPGESVDRCEPQTIQVQAPEHAPTYPALFTHCQYFYVGAGRWQVYVQMWFVEERLKREAYVQVFDYEWHDYERVADLFEASRCLNPADRPTLLRLLSLARHNCPLIDGELQFPSPLDSRPNHFDAFELHEKLAILRLHQQAREQLLRESEFKDTGCGSTGTGVCPTHNPSTLASSVVTEMPGSAAAEKDLQQPEATEATSDDVAACADHVAQLHEQQRVAQSHGTIPLRNTQLGVESDASNEVVQHPRSDIIAPTLFVDVGALAPRNSYCALCDTHDYLHRLDLPAYLTSPCYHCREAMARDAKISSEALLDLHLQHNIPWPAFLQARCGLPNDGRPLEELIAYDCRWRSRQPCRCLVSSGCPILPPCVEFPWLYQSTTANAWNDAISSDAVKKEASPTPVTSTRNDSTLDQDDKPRPTDSKSNSPPQTMTAAQVADSTASIPANTTGQIRDPLLPCANRHPLGAPVTCCHGIHFPALGIPNAATHQPSAATETPQSNQAANTGQSSGGTSVPLATPSGAVT